MKTKFILIIFFVAIISGTAGAYMGMRHGVRVAWLTRETMYFNENADHMEMLFKEGTCEAVKQSILDFERQLDLRKKLNDPWLDPTIYHGDKLLIHGRLYLIEKKLNNPDLGSNRLELAISACQKVGWEECTKEKIEYYLGRVNDIAPITCLHAGN